MPLYAALLILALIVAGFVYGAFWLSARADRQSDDEWKRMSRDNLANAETPSPSRAKPIRKPPVHSTSIAGKGRPDHVL